MKKFVSAKKLQIHLKYKHQVCERFECPICISRFVSKKKLNHHRELTQHHAEEQEDQIVPTEGTAEDVHVDLVVELENPIMYINLEDPFNDMEFELIY